MNIKNFVFPSAALGLAALLLAPSEPQAVGFSVIGGSLSQSQRDVRIFNNFTDPQANNNTNIATHFPGYDGAELAIWKACGEWGGEAHGGTGAGDPTQAVIGNAGANFDISWQGNATGVGGTNDNVHSELAGSNGGVLAFTETPISDGWRIRYYSSWTWQDGPGSDGGVDLQGVACHEFGHALGLGHSNVSGATMFPSISGTGVGARSINSDDKAGVQFIYGVLDTTVKPSITNISGSSTIVITGTNFSTSAVNQVWFTRAGTNTNGQPVKVAGLAAVGGQITVVAPPEAGPGDLLVKNQQNGHKGLSSAWPIDPTAPPPCGTVTSYCTAGTTTNICNATMSGVGTPSVSNAGSFVITANGVEGNKQGLIFYGTSGRNSAPWGGGSNSFLCVSAPTQRTPAQNSGGSAGSCNGSLSLDWNAFVAANPQKPINQGLVAGSTVQAQAWFRDPPAPKTTSLSNAVEFDLCP